MRVAVRNVAGMPYPNNPYRKAEVQAASWASLLATGADVIMAQEASGVAGPFEAPPGWRAEPFSPLGNHGGSVIAVADHVDADLKWRPAHPMLDELKCWLDFGLLRAWGIEIVLVSVHTSKWSKELWTLTGRDGEMPAGGQRPWLSDAVLDLLAEQLAGREAILAGDWNEATNFPTDDDPGATAFFARAKAAGYIEAVNTTFGGPVRTNFTRNATRSYQNDHVFMTSAVAERVDQVAVFNEPKSRHSWSGEEELRLSDHAGILVTFRD